MGKVNLSRICKLVDIANNEDKSVADSFLADLSYAIRKYEEINQPETVSKSYKPSSLHCIRNMYYQVTGQKLETNSAISSDFIGICQSGTNRHNDIQSAISNMKELNIDCEYVNVAKYVKENNPLDNNLPILNEALVKYITEGIPVEETINSIVV